MRDVTEAGRDSCASTRTAPALPPNTGSVVQETSLHRRFCLESGDSETLRIQPVRRVIHLSTFSKVPPYLNPMYDLYYLPQHLLQGAALP